MLIAAVGVSEDDYSGRRVLEMLFDALIVTLYVAALRWTVKKFPE